MKVKIEIAELNDILKNQAQIYHELMGLANQKKAALIKNDIAEIEAIIVIEESLIIANGGWERKRLTWMDQFALEMNEQSDLSLTELAKRYPELDAVHQDLAEVTADLSRLHETNTQLLNQAYKIMDYTMDLLTHQEDAVYSRPGKEAPTTRLSFLDKKV